MWISQMLLVAFVGYWLTGQFKQERVRLSKELHREFLESHEQVIDSMIVVNLVDPLKRDSNLQVQYTIDVKDTSRVHSGARIDFLVKGMKLAMQDSALWSSDSLNVYKTLEIQADSLLLKRVFANRLHAEGFPHFQATWFTTEDTLNAKRNFSHFVFATHADKGVAVKVSEYGWYLLKRLIPQILFVFVLLSITALAFVMAYRSLRKQMQLNQIRNDFIGNISHELKTPVSTVKVALEAIGNRSDSDPKDQTEAYLSMATAEIERLEDLIQRVMQQSLLENHRMEIRMEEIGLKDLIEDVLGLLRHRIQEGQVAIDLDGFPANISLQGDRMLLQGVIKNLVENSLKYTEGPVNIRMEASQKANGCILRFSDQGPGIPEAYLSKVFEPFFRIPTGNNHLVKGYGLGLSYAKAVMEAHGGEINVYNNPDRGCTFTLFFKTIK